MSIFLDNFRHKELLGIHKRPWYAYGLLKAAELAKKNGYKRFTAIEFGVASGRGIKIMYEYKKEIEKILDIKIDIVGFDTGKECLEQMITVIFQINIMRETFQ